MNPATQDRENLSYELFGTAARDLAQTIADDGYIPDIVLSVARGGLLLGGALGYALGVKNVSILNVEFYTGVDSRLPEPEILAPTPSVVDLRGMRVLVADDVADTGKTLEVVERHLANHVAETRFAVIYEKPHTCLHPHYVWRHTDRWINFPWSVLPPVTALHGENKDA